MGIITRRKNVLSNARLQFRYIGLAVIVSLVSVFAGWYVCYTLMSTKLLPAFSISVIENTQKLAYKNLYLTCLIIVPLVAILFLFFTHRLAGAIFKIKKTLQEINNGEEKEIELYGDDELKEITEEINKAVRTFKFAKGSDEK